MKLKSKKMKLTEATSLLTIFFPIVNLEFTKNIIKLKIIPVKKYDKRTTKNKTCLQYLKF